MKNILADYENWKFLASLQSKKPIKGFVIFKFIENIKLQRVMPTYEFVILLMTLCARIYLFISSFKKLTFDSPFDAIRKIFKIRRGMWLKTAMAFCSYVVLLGTLAEAYWPGECGGNGPNPFVLPNNVQVLPVFQNAMNTAMSFLWDIWFLVCPNSWIAHYGHLLSNTVRAYSDLAITATYRASQNPDCTMHWILKFVQTSRKSS